MTGIRYFSLNLGALILFLCSISLFILSLATMIAMGISIVLDGSLSIAWMWLLRAFGLIIAGMFLMYLGYFLAMLSTAKEETIREQGNNHGE